MATTTNSQDLLQWMADPKNKCYFNSSSLSLKTAPDGSGMGVFAKKNLDPSKPNASDMEPNLLLRIHKSMTLNSKNCTISNLLYDEGLEGIDGLVPAVIYELELQEKSPWFGYLKSINHTIDPDFDITHLNRPDALGLSKSKKNGERYILPVPFWDEKEKDLLNGTEVEFLDGLDDAQLRYHYAVAITFARRMNESAGLPIPYLLQNLCPPGNEGEQEVEEEEEEEDGEFDQLKFKQFASLFLAITSRAFLVDNYRDLALVPGADLFNHDSYNEENVHFVSVGEVCPYCGKDACGHGVHGAPESEEEDSDDDEHIELKSQEQIEEVVEQLEEINMEFVHEIEKELEEEQSSEEEEESDYDFDIDPHVAESYLDPEESCDMVLERKVKKGDEVFNTYGDLNNAELLIKYGFCVDSNPNDTLSFGPEISQYVASLVEAIEEYDDEDAKEKMSRLNWWINSGYKELQKYIYIQSQEDDDCCSDEECEGGHDHGCHDDDCQDDACKNEDMANGHEEHGHGHGRDMEGDCCGDDDCDGCEDDDEYEWMEQCKLGYPGHFNGFAIAVATLLTASSETMSELFEAFQDEELMTKPGLPGGFVEKKLIFESNKETNKMLMELIQAKLNNSGDGNNKSADYKRMIRKATGRKRWIYIILMNEKKMLEFALKKLK